MPDKGIYEDLSVIRRRAKSVFIAVAALFVVAALFYWKIQILDHKAYWARAEANRTRDVILPAPRAVLLDRSGEVLLADSRASFAASFIRENSRDEEASILRVAGLLDLDPAVLRARIDKYRTLPAFRPIVIKDRLSLEEVTRVEARKLELPELVIETEPRRIYPFGSLAAHVLGSLQEVTMDELRTTRRDRRPGDMIGRTGLEASYEDRIVGLDGKLVEVVDSLGRKRSELERIEPRPAPGLSLTLDFDLQAKAEELLAGREGAVVALDPETGEILALASFPTYDPNQFVNRFTLEEWSSLSQDPDTPLVNRVLQGLYSPGSVFKPVMALGALSEGIVDLGTTFYCSGSIEIYGNPFRCWFEAGHGALSLREAIRTSCNVFFYQIGRRMPIDTIARYARTLGLGERTGIDIPGEKDGLVPSTEWKKQARNEPWYPGETISVAIGQGPLQVTPLQVAAMTARIANRGGVVRPHLVRGVEDKAPPAEGISVEAFEAVIEGMWRSVNAEGTGRSARVEGFDACGKTGSTQTISRETAEKLGPATKIRKTHSWFTGFAPRNNPRIVVTVLVEYGGMGGATAGPVAGALFAIYKDKYERTRPLS